jgi:hypothetical protein
LCGFGVFKGKTRNNSATTLTIPAS